jgi:hypothetical protein
MTTGIGFAQYNHTNNMFVVMDLLFVQFSQLFVTSSHLGQDYPYHFGMERKAFYLFKSLRRKDNCAGDKIENNEMGGECSADGEETGMCRVLVGKSEGKRPLGRPRRRWEDNIRLDLQEVGCGGMNWIGLAQDRNRLRAIVNAVMNLRVP